MSTLNWNIATNVSRPLNEARFSVWNHILFSQGSAHDSGSPAKVGSSVLAGIIHGMADWDLPCSGPTLAIKAIPHSAPFMLLQYREPLYFTWSFGTRRFRWPRHLHFATMLHTGVLTARPCGPVGMLMVRLKSEFADQLFSAPLGHFCNANVPLDQLFGIGQLSFLKEMLSEATTSVERFACVEKFLVANLYPRQSEPTAHQAAALLTQFPCLPIRRLATQLNVSERHLSRNFRVAFGMRPKQFARIARVERALSTWARGATWADTAYIAGFADQAHMVNDFTKLLGASPRQIVEDVTGVAGKRHMTILK